MATAARLARVPPFERGITIGDFLVPVSVGERLSTRARDALLVLGGTAIIIIGARISFQVPTATIDSIYQAFGAPFGLSIHLPANPYVPITLQTFGVLLAGAALGFRRGVATTGLYLALGLVGLPVFAARADGHFASGTENWGVVSGATGGYIIGFIVAAAVVGRLAELGWDRRLGGAIAAMLVGSALIYAFGLPWLAVSAGLSVNDTLLYGLYPFIPGDLLKLLAVAGVLPVAWWVVRRNPQER
jgi:biotin transport system substrate-specific component